MISFPVNNILCQMRRTPQVAQMEPQTFPEIFFFRWSVVVALVLGCGISQALFAPNRELLIKNFQCLGSGLQRQHLGGIQEVRPWGMLGFSFYIKGSCGLAPRAPIPGSLESLPGILAHVVPFDGAVPIQGSTGSFAGWRDPGSKGNQVNTGRLWLINA